MFTKSSLLLLTSLFASQVQAAFRVITYTNRTFYVFASEKPPESDGYRWIKFSSVPQGDTPPGTDVGKLDQLSLSEYYLTINLVQRDYAQATWSIKEAKERSDKVADNAYPIIKNLKQSVTFWTEEVGRYQMILTEPALSSAQRAIYQAKIAEAQAKITDWIAQISAQQALITQAKDAAAKELVQICQRFEGAILGARAFTDKILDPQLSVLIGNAEFGSESYYARILSSFYFDASIYNANSSDKIAECQKP